MDLVRMLVPHTRQRTSPSGELLYEHKLGCLIAAWSVWGIICGLCMLGLGATLGWSTGSLIHVPPFGVTGVGFLLLGVTMLFWTDELSLNCHQRTYRRRRGGVLRRKQTTGSFNDLSHLELRERVATESGVLSEVLIMWKDEREKPFWLLLTDAHGEAHPLHEQLVRALGLPEEERSVG